MPHPKESSGIWKNNSVLCWPRGISIRNVFNWTRDLHSSFFPRRKFLGLFDYNIFINYVFRLNIIYHIIKVMFCAENLLWIISSSTFSLVQWSNTTLQTQEMLTYWRTRLIKICSERKNSNFFWIKGCLFNKIMNNNLKLNYHKV